MSNSDPTRDLGAFDAFDGVVRDIAQDSQTANSRHTKSTAHAPFSGYQIIRELHRGGQGIVYEALQCSTKRRVAIKVLLSGWFASKTARRRFEREIELVAQLKHPHIISIFHSGETRDREGMQYFVMEYIRGQRLDDYITDNKLVLEDTLRLFATICEAIQYAHHRGVMHRDLKPSNIIVDVDGIPKVLDFGLAKLLTGPVDTVVSITENVIGTLAYMSPEQVRGNQDAIDTRTDVYSLGVILYQLLTGNYPYPVDGSIVDTMRHIVETPPISPFRNWTPTSGVSNGSNGKLRADACPIDADLQAIALKALTKERQWRYQTAGDLARDIRHRLAGEPIEAKRDHRWYVFRKSLHRYRAPVAAGLAFVFLLIFASVALSISYFRAESARQDEAVQRGLAVEFRLLAEERLLLARRHAYASDMLLAQQEWEKANVGSVREYLDAQIPEPGQEDLRGFEWHYLRRLCSSDIATFEEDSAIFSVAFSPDGETLAVGLEEIVVLRNIISGKDTRLRGHTSLVLSVAFSPDGRLLATGSQDETIRLWDVASGFEVAQAKVGVIGAVRFSPDGKTLAAVGIRYPERTAIVGLWTVPDLTPHANPPGHGRTVKERSDYYYDVVFTPDGRNLLTGGADGTVTICAVADGKIQRQFSAHHGQVSAMALSPDGRILATAGNDENLECLIKLWNAHTGEPVAVLAGYEQQVTTLAFSPDGRLLLSGGDDRTVRLWDVNTRQLKNTVRGHADHVLAVAFSSTGSMFATGSKDETYKLWDVDVRQEALRLRGNEAEVHSVAVSPDGRLIASAGRDQTVRLWHADSGALAGTLEGHKYDSHELGVSLIAFAPDGRTLVTSSSQVPLKWRDGKMHFLKQEAASELKWWDTARLTEQATIDLPGDDVLALAFSADGSTLATAVSHSKSGTVDLWDVASKTRKASLTSDGINPTLSGARLPTFTCLAYSPDGAWLAAGRDDGTVSLWDLSTSREYQLQGDIGTIMAVAFGPQGERLAVSCNGTQPRSSTNTKPTFTLWDVTTRQQIFTRRDDGTVKAISFSPLGQTVATAGYYTPVNLRDVRTGQLRWSFDMVGSAHRTSLTFSPDGRRLAAADGDTIHIWDAGPLATR